jgi:hypothetical protein
MPENSLNPAGFEIRCTPMHIENYVTPFSDFLEFKLFIKNLEQDPESPPGYLVQK